MMLRSTKPRRFRQALSGATAIVAVVLAIPAPATAFDTGHHFDMTEDALRTEGFGSTAIRMVQLNNWFVDYYSLNPIPDSQIVRLRDRLRDLHFTHEAASADAGGVQPLTASQLENGWRWL